MVQQFYLSIGCLLFLIVGRHDVNIDEFLGWQSRGPLMEKIELVCSMEVQIVQR